MVIIALNSKSKYSHNHFCDVGVICAERGTTAYIVMYAVVERVERRTQILRFVYLLGFVSERY